MKSQQKLLGQKNDSLFGVQFRAHVSRFIKKMVLTNEKKLVLAISGGVDSVVLLDIVAKLKIPFSILHFNHGTRKEENKKEEELVLELGRFYGVDVDLHHLNLSFEQSDFENKARDLRQKIYRAYTQQGFFVALGHHIDDSLEWSLMQSFKQSTLEGTLGIAVFNNGLVRPLMCATKKQILCYAKKEKIKWSEDSSNQDVRFMRNKMRHEVVKKISPDYPAYLKNYVAKQNELALLLSKHRLQNLENKNNVGSDFAKKDSFGSFTFLANEKKDLESFLKKGITHFSALYTKQRRGELRDEVQKLLVVLDKIRQDSKLLNVKGPMSFSGGVHVHLMKETLCITHQNLAHLYREFDEEVLKLLQNKTQIPQNLLMIDFPYLVIDKKRTLKKKSKLIHSLMPKTCLYLKSCRMNYHFLPLLDEQEKSFAIKDAHLLDSSILGL